MASKPHDVLATREARAALPSMLERFRQDGAEAEPIVIGAHRRPEAVVLSYERYLRLVGGRAQVAAILDQRAVNVGAQLSDDEAMALADEELHVMRREREVHRE